MIITPSLSDPLRFVVKDPIVDPMYLLGCNKRKDGSCLVEANYLNMHQLGIPFSVRDKTTGVLWDEDCDLFDYQKSDVERMVQQKFIFNANKMGYGKTVETIVSLRFACSPSTGFLILTPKAVLSQWESEIKTWWPDCPYKILVKPNFAQIKLQHPTIVITNYEALQNARILDRLCNHIWDAIVLDESHRVKNRKSQRWGNVLKFSARRKICLSGTPILNRIDDLWTQLHFLDWRYSGMSYWNFVYFFCEMLDKEVKGISPDPKKQELLNWLVSLACIRNLDMQMTQGKRSYVVPIAMTVKQKALYKNTKELIFDSLPEHMTIADGLTHMLRLRQVTSCPEQFEIGCTNAKFDWIESQLEDNPDVKFVVYSNWSTTLKALQQRLGTKVCQLYTGDQNMEQRTKAKERFIERSSCRVLAGTIGALGVGVDGLQKVCSIAIFIDKDWSPEINEQAEDRLNRYPQQELVQCYYLECTGTVDKYISRINRSKAEDIKKALMGEGV